MTKHSGHMVIELTSEGIPEEELVPEPLTEEQESILRQLDPHIQERVRRGYPIVVADFETGRRIAEFNPGNVKPSKYGVEALARTLLGSIQEYFKDPQKVAEFEAWKKEHGKK